MAAALSKTSDPSARPSDSAGEGAFIAIGDAAQASGLPAKTIRYYEEIGLIRPLRQANGYRAYGPREIAILRFLHRARGLGFSIGDCRQLLDLYNDRGRASADVREIAARHVEAIDRRIAELAGLRSTLGRLIAACHGDDRPDCPILEDMAGAKPARCG